MQVFIRQFAVVKITAPRPGLNLLTIYVLFQKHLFRRRRVLLISREFLLLFHRRVQDYPA